MATLMHENGTELAMIQQIVEHAKTDTTPIYVRTSLRQLLETHGRAHPAERPEESAEE